MNKAQLTAKLAWRGAAIQRAVHKAAAKGLHESAEYLLEEANKTIPHDEGIMQDSGKASVDEQRLEAAVSYDTPYVKRQHQNTKLRHPNGRRAKWLKLTLDEKQKKIMAHIRSSVENAMKGGGGSA
jgi:hypothetical protein